MESLTPEMDWERRILRMEFKHENNRVFTIQEEDESGNEGYSDQKQGYKNRADRGGYTEMKEQIYQVKYYLTPYVLQFALLSSFLTGMSI